MCCNKKSEVGMKEPATKARLMGYGTVSYTSWKKKHPHRYRTSSEPTNVDTWDLLSSSLPAEPGSGEGGGL